MRLSRLTRFVAPLMLLTAAPAYPIVFGPAGLWVTLGNFTTPAHSSGAPAPLFTSTTPTLFNDGQKIFATYNLSSAGALSGVSRSVAVTFAGTTLFQCNAKTTCPGNNDSIAIHVTIIRTSQFTATALVEYNDRQNGATTGVSTNYTTHLTGLDLINTAYDLALNGGSTGVSAAAGDVTAEWGMIASDDFFFPI